MANASHYKAVRRVLLITLALNLLAAGAKLTVGYLTGALSLLAGGFDSVFDAAANVMALAGIHLASRPPDETHPYGHRKFETLTAIAIAVLLFVTFFRLLQTAVEQLIGPLVTPEVTVWSFAVLLFSMAVQLAVTRYESRKGRELRSDLLQADAAHTQADFWVSLSIIGGLIAVEAGYPIADPLLAIGISFVIAKIGIDIVRESSQVLADAAAIDPDQIQRIALSIDGVRGAHAIRSRGPAAEVWIDMHIQVDPQLGIERAHALGHDVKARILDEIAGVQDVVIHIEPQSSLDPEGDAVKAVRRVAGQFPVTPHEIHVFDTDGAKHASLHVELERDLSLADAHELATRLEKTVAEQVPEISTVTTHLEPLSKGATSSAVRSRELPAVKQVIEETAAGIDGLWDCHDVALREVDGELFLVVHCLCEGDVSVADAHQLASLLEQRLQSRLPDVDRIVTHVEPPEAR